MQRVSLPMFDITLHNLLSLSEIFPLFKTFVLGDGFSFACPWTIYRINLTILPQPTLKSKPDLESI